MPTITASTWSRSSWTSRRERSLVIQRDSPVTVAIFPSKLAATLSKTNGRLVTMYFINTSFSAVACSSRTASVTSMPAWQSSATPLPRTSGLGSRVAVTTRPMPAEIMVFVQGGVRLP
jgi:hypothetical protein